MVTPTATAASPALRVGFAGTPAFAATALTALLAAGHTIALVLTQPDRPKGRGLALQPSAVKQVALAQGLAIAQPATLKDAEARTAIMAVPLDVLVVAAYGLILPPAILAWPRHGCINIHASLLPRWRGAAPIVRAVQAGDADSGITIMQMDAGLDTGAVISMAAVPLAADATAGALHDTLAALGARAIVAALAQLQRDGSLAATAQPADGATYARKVERAEARIDWLQPAAVIARTVRAFDPVPAAWTTLHDQPLKVWRAEAARESAAKEPPGTVLAVDGDAIAVACGDGAVRITELQPAGARRMDVAAFRRGHSLVAGMVLGA